MRIRDFRGGVFCLLLLLPALAGSTIHTVNPDGNGDFPNIQAAINNASVIDGDIIELGSGTFTGSGNRDISCAKGLTIRSSAGDPDSCTIDCQGSGGNLHFGISFGVTGRVEASLENVTVKNGYYHFGGGVQIWSCSPTISGCIINNNSAVSYGHGHGGGIYIKGGSPLVEDCLVRNNYAYGDGGGIFCWNTGALITSCRILDNQIETIGGGVRVTGSSAVTIEDCTISGNSGGNEGGAIHAGAPTTIEYCLMSDNSASAGGAIYCGSNHATTITYCVIVSNEASIGGGIFCDQFSAQITHCTLAYNDASYGGGGGIYYWTSMNNGGLLEYDIVAFSTDGEGIGCEDASAAFTLSCCDIYDNDDGDYVGCINGQNGVNGNISQDPLFCGTMNPNEPYSIHADSPCADVNHATCTLIGALDVGCGVTATKQSSWSEVKSLY